MGDQKTFNNAIKILRVDNYGYPTSYQNVHLNLVKKLEKYVGHEN